MVFCLSRRPTPFSSAGDLYFFTRISELTDFKYNSLTLSSSEMLRRG